MKKKIIWQSIVIAIGIVVLIALCFFVWKSPEVYSQGMAIVVSAALGAILTAIITRMVIGSQLQSEQEKEKNIKIYEMKMQVYSDFISKMWNLYADGRLDAQELNVLRSEVFNKLIFMLRKEDFGKLTKNIEELRRCVEDAERKEDDPDQIIKTLGMITRILRTDILNESEPEGDNLAIPLWKAFLTRNQKNETDNIEEPTTDNIVTPVNIESERQYWHMNMVDRTMQQNALKNGIYELALIEYGEDKRTNILKQVNKGDLIFLYNKGNMFLGIFEAIGRRIFYYENEILKEDIIADLSYPKNISTVTDETQLKIDIEKYDVYGGVEDGADFCANLIVRPLACMLIPKDEDVAAYRPTICRYWKEYGDSILLKYKKALDARNAEFGKIDGITLDCDIETFKKL